MLKTLNNNLSITNKLRFKIIRANPIEFNSEDLNHYSKIIVPLKYRKIFSFYKNLSLMKSSRKIEEFLLFI